ncbi:hypothetical protein ACP4OV_007421 [Aristida adscensionis]
MGLPQRSQRSPLPFQTLVLEQSQPRTTMNPPPAAAGFAWSPSAAVTARLRLFAASPASSPSRKLELLAASQLSAAAGGKAMLVRNALVLGAKGNRVVRAAVATGDGQEDLSSEDEYFDPALKEYTEEADVICSDDYLLKEVKNTMQLSLLLLLRGLEARRLFLLGVLRGQAVVGAPAFSGTLRSRETLLRIGKVFKMVLKECGETTLQSESLINAMESLEEMRACFLQGPLIPLRPRPTYTPPRSPS